MGGKSESLQAGFSEAKRSSGQARVRGAMGAFCLLALSACEKGPSLSHEKGQEDVDLGPVNPTGPQLGAIADRTPIYEKPTKRARELGYLHAGALVTRSEKGHEASDCTEGYYAVFPRGYVCTQEVATLETKHPTLAIMALPPRLDSQLPFVYARTCLLYTSDAADE